MQGRIVNLIAGVYFVEANNNIFQCVARGNFRHKKLKPLVGDIVEFDENLLTIDEIHPRHSELNRPAMANIDHLLIVHSYKQPEFSFGLIFKYLTYANMNGIKVSVIISKIDKCENNEDLHSILDVFHQINVPIYLVNSKKGEGVEQIKKLFTNNVVALIGTSGVGKSTLLNAINPSYNRKEGEYSSSLKGGKHQTKEVVLLPYEGGYLADTPGFYSLQLNLTKEDLAKYYPGMYLKSQECYFSNCLHLSEKDCAIIKEVKEGILPEVVYDNYLQLLQEASSTNRRI